MLICAFAFTNASVNYKVPDLHNVMCRSVFYSNIQYWQFSVWSNCTVMYLLFHKQTQFRSPK